MRFIFFEFHHEVLLVGLAAIIVLLIVEWRLRKCSFPCLLCAFGLLAYLLVLVDVVFLPIRLAEGWPGVITAESARFTLSHVNLVPFNFGNLLEASRGAIFWELAGNVLLTVPLGFLLPFLTRITARKALWVALLAGLGLEGLQLVFTLLGIVSAYGHSIDINDCLLNAAGVLLGYGLFRLVSVLPAVRRFQHQSALQASGT